MWRTAAIFFDNPTEELYLMDISRRLGLAHTSVLANLLSLIKEGVITKKTLSRGSRRFPVYSANMNDKRYKKHKKLYNLLNIMESGLVESVEQVVMPKSIVLFGSYSRGEDTEESDIDLFVESLEKKIDLPKFEKILNRKIQLHFNRDFSSYPVELKNNILNGIVLQGFIEAFR
jgi:predicted nucleotidyltransferase